MSGMYPEGVYEHTRQRSVNNFATNLLEGSITYNLIPKKPEMNIDIIDDRKLLQ